MRDFNKLKKLYRLQLLAVFLFPLGFLTGIIWLAIVGLSIFLKFAKKESSHAKQKNAIITEETIETFKLELKKLILEICNPNIDFIEKEV